MRQMCRHRRPERIRHTVDCATPSRAAIAECVMPVSLMSKIERACSSVSIDVGCDSPRICVPCSTFLARLSRRDSHTRFSSLLSVGSPLRCDASHDRSGGGPRNANRTSRWMSASRPRPRLTRCREFLCDVPRLGRRIFGVMRRFLPPLTGWHHERTRPRSLTSYHPSVFGTGIQCSTMFPVVMPRA